MSKNVATLDQALGRAAKLHRVLREEGLRDEVVQMPINDPEMRRRLVRFWNSGGYEPTTRQELARAIGILVFGIEEAIQHFGVKPTKTQLSALAEIPFTETVLRDVRNTHILVAVFPLSILEIWDVAAPTVRKDFIQKWINNQAFAKTKEEASWQLVRKTPAENSTLSSWKENQAFLGENEEVPNARVIFYTMIGHFLVTGEKLFDKLVYVYTSDVNLIGWRVAVGGFGGCYPLIECCWVDPRVVVGMASARLPAGKAGKF